MKGIRCVVMLAMRLHKDLGLKSLFCSRPDHNPTSRAEQLLAGSLPSVIGRFCPSAHSPLVYCNMTGPCESILQSHIGHQRLVDVLAANTAVLSMWQKHCSCNQYAHNFKTHFLPSNRRNVNKLADKRGTCRCCLSTARTCNCDTFRSRQSFQSQPEL